MARVKAGSIHRLKSGKWFARYSAPDGRRYGKAFATKGDANTWLQQTYASISRGDWDKRDTLVTLPFADYAERWVGTRRVRGRELADRTREGYRDLLDRFILPTFGPRPVHSIGREDVDRWYDRTAKNTPTYRAKAYSLLRTILNSAVDDGYLPVNPARIRGAGQVERTHKVRPATLDELETITDAIPPRYRLLVLLAAWCALRFGELTELRRGDVDTRDGVIRVRRGVVMVGGSFVVKTPTSSAGIRDVAIPPHLLPLVREHLLAHTAPGSDGLLFPSASGGARGDEHLRQSSLARVFYPARRKAGRPDLRFHDLRHTGAVLAAQTGATLAELMGRLGHSTSQAAMRYQHAAADRDAIIASRLSAMAQAHRDAVAQ